MLNGRCFRDEKWTCLKAAQVCSNEGGRLCTEDEILADVVQGTGCNLDLQVIWSAKECDGGHYTMPSRLNQMDPDKIVCNADDAVVVDVDVSVAVLVVSV